MSDQNSETLFEQARELFPGGVNSPVRSFRSVGGNPIFMRSGSGAWMTDVSGQRYLDYIGSWGPLLLGHSHPEVVRALSAQLDRGLSFGAPTEAEIELAQLVLARLPQADSLRFVNSGTEAGMTAIRLARGSTGRDLIVKFAGGYHGHSDSLLVKAGSGAQTLGVQDSAGVPAALAELTRVLPYNDSDAASACFAAEGDRIAAVLVEPIAGNMGMIPPLPGFLEHLRDLCRQQGALLIFDEVMTGFRVAWGGASELYGITPDLLMLGKVIGGGMPVGAVAGRAELMHHLAPIGEVYQAGTLSGNPLAMVAGTATLKLAGKELYPLLQAHADELLAGLSELAEAAGVPFSCHSAGGMFGFFFSDEYPSSLQQVQDAAVQRYRHFFHAMLAESVYLPPSAWESCFLSAAHDGDTLAFTLAAASKAMKEIAP